MTALFTYFAENNPYKGKLLTNLLALAFLFLLIEPTQAEGYGTGFFVTEDGYIVTNHHVVDGFSIFHVRYDGEWIKAKLIHKDPTNDLAMLRVDGSNYTCLALANGNKVRSGQDAFTVGFPDPTTLGFAPKTTKGEISALSGIKDDIRFYQTTVAIQPGNSGGPLCNELGQVIGVTTSTINFKSRSYLPQNVNYAVKSFYVAALAQAVQCELRDPGAVPNRTFAEAQSLVERAVVSIRADSPAPPKPPAEMTQRPPVSKEPARKKMKVSYSGNDGVNIRDSRYINTSSNLHGALFPQETFLLEQIGDVVETGGRQWVQLEVKGWIPVKNHSQVFLSPIGNGKWKVNKTSDGFLSMRTGTSSKTPLVCKLKYATVITELNRDFTDSTYHYVFGTFRGWAVKRSSSQEYIRYIY